MWKFQHADGHREINELHVPVGQPVRLTLASEDVIHSFFVPAFRFKRDVVPGRFATAWFEATKPGKYHLFCAEFCGTRHSGMIGWVYAMKPADYQAWLAGGAAGRDARCGRRQALRRARLQHLPRRSAGRARARRWTGLFGKPVPLAERPDRHGRRELHPRVDRQPAGEAGRRLPPDHADLSGPDQRGGAPPADRVHQIALRRASGSGRPAAPLSPRRAAPERKSSRAMSATAPTVAAVAAPELPERRLRRALVAADDRPQADRDPLPDRRSRSSSRSADWPPS